MKRLLMIAAIATLTPLSAHAERMTDAGFIAASRCLAYTDHTALAGDGFDVGALREAVSEGERRVHTMAISRSEANARNIGRLRAESAGELQTLRDRRDAACAAYISQGLVQAPATSASAG